MPTLKSSSTPARSGSKGPDIRKGIAHYQTLITVEKSKNGSDTGLIRKYEAIIRRLENELKKEK
jgi:hypothetical protein